MEAAKADGSATNDGPTSGGLSGFGHNSQASGHGRTPERIGARLAAARTAAGIDLTDIARDTRVPLRHLRALENDAHDELPALPYAIGFVKSFARAVGMDADEVAARFKAETSKLPHVPASTPLEPLDARRLPPRGLVAASVAGLVLLLGGLGAYGAGWFDPPVASPVPVETAVAPPSTASTPQAPAPAAGTASEPTTSLANGASPVVPPADTAAPPGSAIGVAAVPAGTLPTVRPVASGSGVTIIAGDDAWIRITHLDPVTGRVASLKTGVLAKGERYDVPPGETGARLWTGRAGALQISVAGRVLPPLGGPVATVRNVSLDPAALVARLAPPAAAPAGTLPR